MGVRRAPNAPKRPRSRGNRRANRRSERQTAAGLGRSGAPATVALRADDGPRAFTLTADGVTVPATADAFVLTGDGYDLTLTFSDAFVHLTIDNRSASVVRVVSVFSRFTLPDGATSAVVTGAYLRDRSPGALPFDVEPASEGRVSLIPIERSPSPRRSP